MGFRNQKSESTQFHRTLMTPEVLFQEVTTLIIAPFLAFQTRLHMTPGWRRHPVQHHLRLAVEHHVVLLHLLVRRRMVGRHLPHYTSLLSSAAPIQVDCIRIPKRSTCTSILLYIKLLYLPSIGYVSAHLQWLTPIRGDTKRAMR